MLGIFLYYHGALFGTRVLNRPCSFLCWCPLILPCFLLCLLFSNVCLFLLPDCISSVLASSLFLSVCPMWGVVKVPVCSVNVRDWRDTERNSEGGQVTFWMHPTREFWRTGTCALSNITQHVRTPPNTHTHTHTHSFFPATV